MSVPALRQPKLGTGLKKSQKKTKIPPDQYVILTLKNSRKLVVLSDAYHGIITAGNMYKCVFCNADMELDSRCKEKHIKSSKHSTTFENCPHVEEYAVNLIRELTKESFFCTICSVVIRNINLMSHINTEVHMQELEKATLRADAYEPVS